MFETNVMGLMRMTRALLPRLIASGDGHVINVGSVAAYAVLYTAIALIFGLILFEDRDLA